MQSSASEPADTVITQRELDEIIVRTPTVRRLMRATPDGALTINPRISTDLPSFLSSGDPVAALRALPSVATSNDLSAALCIEGAGNEANLFETDGIRIVNPMHMLGFYSAFNPAYYHDITFRPSRHPASTPSLTGGYISAQSLSTFPDSTFSASITSGLIESHGALRLPVGKNWSIAAAARHTYLNLLFPDILTVGSSRLKYGFTDLNASVTGRIGQHTITGNIFANHDDMRLKNRNDGAKDGDFGWRNIAGGIGWAYRDMDATVSLTRYSNSFMMAEGGRAIDLPSSLTQATARFHIGINRLDLSAESNYRYTSGQHNRDNATASSASSLAIHSGEHSAAATWHYQHADRLEIDAGLRLTLYHTPGFTTVSPQPRVDIRYSLRQPSYIYLSLGRYTRFDRLIEESSTGLPADFWTCADNNVRPLTAYSLHAGIGGYITPAGISWTVGAYGRLNSNIYEFAGSILDLASSGYNPVDHLLHGDGYAFGLSAMAMRQTGAVRGRIAYNIGTARNHLDGRGSGTYPAAHDRTHDLNISLAWTPISSLTLALNFIYATGTPYTREQYGYMIGENLICEYFPHNSSRLPDYRRMDIAATWLIHSSPQLNQRLQLSVYNVLGLRNTLFSYTTYSTDNGIERLSSVMNTIIPSLAYTIEF